MYPPKYPSFEEIHSFIAPTATWPELERMVARLRAYDRLDDQLRRLPPIHQHSVKHLRANGWMLVPERMQDYGRCVAGETKSIWYNDALQHYKRDATVLHELTHADYGRIFPADGESSQKARNEIIVEWLSRRSRADPATLRAVITEFGLEPHVYDKASADAFAPQRQQQATCPYATDRFRHVQMDEQFTGLPSAMQDRGDQEHAMSPLAKSFLPERL